MTIMIAGAGTVGFTLAQLLSHRHNVIVVDKEIEILNRLEEKIDILTLLGNIEDPKTFQSLAIKSIDLFIAVTDSDEANLLSTLMQCCKIRPTSAAMPRNGAWMKMGMAS